MNKKSIVVLASCALIAVIALVVVFQGKSENQTDPSISLKERLASNAGDESGSANGQGNTATKGQVAEVSADGEEEMTQTGIPKPRGKMTERMMENYEGLSKLYSAEELAFESGDFVDQISESLGFYGEDWMFGLAKLEMAMKNMNPEQMQEALNLLSGIIPADNEEHAKAYRVVFREWGAQEGEKAVNYAMGNFPENVIRLDAGSEAMKSWAQQDPYSASKTVAELEEAFGKDYLVFAMPYTFMESDPQAAINWALELPGHYRENTLLHSMIKWLNHDSDSAVDYVTKLAHDPDYVDMDNKVLVSEAAGHVVRKDVDYALEWVKEMPEGWPKETAMVAIVDWWTDANPEKASEWVMSLDEGPATDAVVDRFARVAAWIDPEGAAAWAESIGHDSVREQSISRVLKTWSSLDAESAKNWANQNGYSYLLSL